MSWVGNVLHDFCGLASAAFEINVLQAGQERAGSAFRGHYDLGQRLPVLPTTVGIPGRLVLVVRQHQALTGIGSEAGTGSEAVPGSDAARQHRLHSGRVEGFQES